MLDRFMDSSLKGHSDDNGRVRLTVDAVERRLWLAAPPLTRRLADLCLVGGALGGTALIASPERRVSGRVSDVIGKS